MVIVEVVRKVRFEVRMMGGVVPAEQRIAVAEQLVSIAGVMGVVVEPDLKSQRRGDDRLYFDPKSVPPVGFQISDPGVACDGRCLQKPQSASYTALLYLGLDLSPTVQHVKDGFPLHPIIFVGDGGLSRQRFRPLGKRALILLLVTPEFRLGPGNLAFDVVENDVFERLCGAGIDASTHKRLGQNERGLSKRGG